MRQRKARQTGIASNRVAPVLPVAETARQAFPKLISVDRSALDNRTLVDHLAQGTDFDTAATALTGEAAVLFDIYTAYTNLCNGISGNEVVAFGSNISKCSDDALNRVFVFEGYGSRTRDALLDILMIAADGNNADIRYGVYLSIKSFDRGDILDFLVKSAFKDSKNAYAIFDAISNFLEKHPEETENAVSALSPLLGHSDYCVRQECVNCFSKLGDVNALRLAWQAVARESDSRSASALHVMEHPNEKITESLGDEYFRLLADAMNKQLRAWSEYTIFVLFAVTIRDIEGIRKLMELLTPETKSLLLEKGTRTNPNINYTLGYEYAKAAIEGQLQELEVLGNKIRYFVLPHDLLDAHGRVNGFAIALSDKVPENLKPIVLYHEYIESLESMNGNRANAHEKAVETELPLARSLGIEREYLEWLSEVGEENRF